MRNIVIFFCVILAAAAVTACASAREQPVGELCEAAETQEMSSKDAGASTNPTQEEAGTGGSDLESETITDKNLKLKEPYVYVIEREDMDGFWDGYQLLQKGEVYGL